MNGSQDPQNPATDPNTATPVPPPAAPVPPAPGLFQTLTATAQDPRAKSPALACFLSAMPGLGQIYTGYYVRGFAHAITIAALVTLLSTGHMRGVTPFLAVFLAFFWMYNIIDAGRRASFFNQMLAGGTEANAFPPEMKIPGVSGSIFAGVGLIALGAIALSYTKYDLSLEWVEDWWPVAPILIGLYLVGLAIMDRKKDEK